MNFEYSLKLKDGVLVWNDVDKTSFDIIVTLHTENDDVDMPFNCSSLDNTAHSQRIWERVVVDGEFGEIGEYQPPEE
jgi:hypothetical protein